MIWGFRREVEENCYLLGHYAVNSGKKLPLTSCVITQKSDVFRLPYRSPPTPDSEAANSSSTPANIYETTWNHTPWNFPLSNPNLSNFPNWLAVEIRDYREGQRITKKQKSLRDSRLSPLCGWDLRSYAMPHSTKFAIPYRRFGTTYRSPSPLKMGPIGCPETSVRDHHYTMRNIPEDRKS